MRRGKSQLEILEENRAAGKYTVAMSTDIDTKNKNILDAVFKFHKAHDRQSAEKYARLFLRELIYSFDFDYIKSEGYYEGIANPNSYFIFTDRDSAKLFVENANKWFGQESIIAFGPDCTYNIHEEPVDYSTKIDDVYVVFNFDGDVLETPPVPEDNRDIKTEATKEDEMLELGGYRVRKKYSSPDYVVKTGEHWTEDDVALAVYNVAPIIYNNKAQQGAWDNTSYTEEDFVNEAALYTINLFRNKYFSTDFDSLEPIIYRMLNSHFVRNVLNRERRDYSRNLPVLNRPKGDENDTEFIDYLESEYLPPSEFVDRSLIDRGEAIAEKIIDSLNFLPYRTRKHTYVGQDKDLGKLQLSEQNIARLLFLGETPRGIIRIYGKEVDNIGSSSEASFILHKVKEVIEKIVLMVEKLPNKDKKALKAYMEHF